MSGLFKNTKVLGLFLGFVFAGVSGPSWAQSGIYQEGQVWVIESGDYQGVEVIIAHVEDHPRLDEVIHVMIPDPIENLDGTISSQMSHIPFSEEGLLKSDINLYREDETVAENWKVGYEIWNAAALEEEAGIFSVSVSEVIDTNFSKLSLLETETPIVTASEEDHLLTVETPIITDSEDFSAIETEAPILTDSVPVPVLKSEALIIADTEEVPLLEGETPITTDSKNGSLLEAEAPVFTEFEEAPSLEAEAPIIIYSEARPIVETEVPVVSDSDDSLVSTNPTPKIIDPNDDGFDEIQHAGFTDDFLARIKAVTDLFEEVDGVSYDEAVKLYEADPTPESNLAVSEEMARVYTKYCETDCPDLATKKEVYQVVLFAGMLPADDVVELMNVDSITKDDIREIVSQYSLAPDVIEKIEGLE